MQVSTVESLNVTWNLLTAGSPVLGYLAAGVLIGPYALSIIKNVHGTRMIAEFGVVFLLFNIGLEVPTSELLIFQHGLSLLCTFIWIIRFTNFLICSSRLEAVAVFSSIHLIQLCACMLNTYGSN